MNHIEMELPPLSFKVQPVITREEYEERPYGFVSVIADDEEHHQINARSAFKEAFTNQPYENRSFVIAESVEDLLLKALTGKNGEQTNVVTLDDNYRQARGRQWEITLDTVNRIAEKLGIAIPHLLPREPDEADKKPIIEFYEKIGKETTNIEWKNISFPNLMPNNLYGTADSISLALLLRGLGYEGKIFIISSTPPLAKEIQEKTIQMRETMPWLPDGLPVNGVCTKRSFQGKFSYANTAIETSWGLNWDYVDITAHDMKAAFAELLRNEKIIN